MFAQLLITVVLVWGVAEILSRLLLGVSLRCALQKAFSSEPILEMTDDGRAPHADLRQLLDQRQEQLQLARQRLKLASRARATAADLAKVEQALAEVEGRLADIEQERADAGHCDGLRWTPTDESPDHV